MLCHRNSTSDDVLFYFICILLCFAKDLKEFTKETQSISLIYTENRSKGKRKGRVATYNGARSEVKKTK